MTETDGYAHQDPGAVSRRFGLSAEALDAYLLEHRLRRRDLSACEFDLESAQLDIEVAPDGISRTELARTMFRELQQAQRSTDSA